MKSSSRRKEWRSSLKATLKARISSITDVHIGVIGVGYVGLPLAIRLAEKGFSVIGIDVRREVVEKLKAGSSTVEGIGDDRLKQVIGKGLKMLLVRQEKPDATSKRTLSRLVGIDIFLVCVPTPLDQSREWEPDTTYIERARDLLVRVCEIEKKARKLPKERLIVLESTTYPGTTREFFAPLLAKFQSGRKWYLAYSPERMNPGLNAYDENSPLEDGSKDDEGKIPGAFQITRIIGGIDKVSTNVGKAFYETVFKKVRTVRNLETAEMIKLVENTFRFVSIAFANEISKVTKVLGLDVWEVIDAARGKKFGFELCFPGLIGGHCLPIDPHYLSSATRNRRLSVAFVDVGETEHQDMRREAFDLTARLLNQQNRGIANASILFFGVSYKKDIGDIRESAAIDLMEKLYSSGAKLAFWDPVRARHPAKPRLRLKFTSEQQKALPPKLSNKLVWDPLRSEYYIEPKEVNGDWKALRSRVKFSQYNCIVLGTNHAEFRSAYRDLILSDQAPPIADLTNAINLWLKDTKFTGTDRKRINRKLRERKNYMLLGLH